MILSSGDSRTLSSIQMGPRLGHGGEGDVFALANDDSLVAKIYHHSPSALQVAKLSAMVSCQSAELNSFAAWPQRLVFNNSGVTGFLMPRISSSNREIFQLYCPTHRRKYFPSADFDFVVHAALNVSAAFAAVHSMGHVIGDVNQKNILVDSRALVKIIDCDSFQIRKLDGHVCPCRVGVADYTPPELQHKRFVDVERTTNHDNFGLAVLLFHLLLMGRHPFAGKFTGIGEGPDLRAAIENHMFPYAIHDRPFLNYAPPPSALPINILPDEIIRKFESAFLVNGKVNRPGAKEWCESLISLKNSLKTCKHNPRHHYPAHNEHCPWCESSLIGVSYFCDPGNADRNNGDFVDPSVVQSFQAAVERLQALSVPKASMLLVPPSAELQKLYWSKRLRYGFFVPLACFIFCGPMNYSSVYTNGPILIAMSLLMMLLGAFSALFLIERYDLRHKAKVLNAQSKQLQVELDAMLPADVIQQLNLAQHVLSTYKQLESDLSAQIDAFKLDEQRALQWQFLNQRTIDQCRHELLGPEQLWLLRSLGVQSAADLTDEKLDSIPAISTELRTALMTWREGLVHVYLPSLHKLDTSACLRQLIDSYRTKARVLENNLNSQKQCLAKLAAELNPQALDIAAYLRSVEAQKAQVEANLRALKKL